MRSSSDDRAGAASGDGSGEAPGAAKGDPIRAGGGRPGDASGTPFGNKPAPRLRAAAIRFVREWGLILVVGGGLYLTGWHTEVIGRIQQVLLHTGILNPNVDERSADASATASAGWPDAGRLIAETLDGEVVHLSDLRGQVVFINFWATWCPPCIAEMPSIERLAEDFAGSSGASSGAGAGAGAGVGGPLAVGSDSGADQPSGQAPVAFMLISLDEDRAAVEAFVRRKEITLPVYMLRMKDREPMDVSRIPSTYVVTPDGRIAYSRGGLANYDNRQFKSFLKGLSEWESASDAAPDAAPDAASDSAPAAASRTP